MSLSITKEYNENTVAIRVGKKKDKFINYDPEEKEVPVLTERGIKKIIGDNNDNFEEDRKQILLEYSKQKGIMYDAGDGWLFTMPQYDKRNCVLVVGSSGSGKSTWIRNYALLYQEFYEDNKIYLISDKKESESLEGYKKEKPGIFGGKLKFNLLELSEESATFMNNNMNEFKNSLIIVDDCICLSKKQKEMNEAEKNMHIELKGFVEKVLKLGREPKISLIISKHVLNAGANMTVLKEEAHSLIYFPRVNLPNHLKAFLNNIGVSNNTVNEIINNKCRWVDIKLKYPFLLIDQEKIKIYK